MRARREGWKHPNPKKQPVIQQFLMSDSITTTTIFVFLSLAVSPLVPLIKFLPCLPRFHSKKQDGQQKALSSPKNISVFRPRSRAHAHTQTHTRTEANVEETEQSRMKGEIKTRK